MIDDGSMTRDRVATQGVDIVVSAGDESGALEIDRSRSAVFIKGDEQLQFAGKRISVVHVGITAPGGEQYVREVVKHPGAVVIVPVSANGEVHLLRQYRAPVGESLVEIPAGTRDVPGEPPEETARRELKEEMGLVADTFTLLGRVYNSPGFCTEETYIYLATGLHQREAEREGPEEKYMDVLKLPLDDAIDLCTTGAIHDAQTIIGLMLAQRRLED
ncbi:MAG: NUDIX hydrolase [Actinobacteria bacterium]|nr:NUDIX hydrolase [Actinomycetota bacterium]MCL5445872.1 NUDIX hydrolase [Actinomycetota bacterium]